ncbi:hypothetical protein ACXHQ0_19275 [Vibrio antiquarius]|uniref:Uncharacterized protein n=1 Tax=Vibrio parahaemolyticus TaxID=670 RepID=A0AA46UTF5_VIBPH|nr:MULTISPECIES: hypothetical protein [Vibrio harveyi group]KOE88115.1 hypothetical protein ACS91_12765 [Vibrio parahaemolyticus]MCS0313532.1 hypothetical protein [Vibrio diabolicus]UYV30379.1 hypothetical protein M5598_25565 [Vibrio parahaemolyticus]UYW19611.1 hypothetical protein IF561_25090 [Vibrio parahaemolyticus]
METLLGFFAMPFVIFGILFVFSIYMAFCENLRTTAALSFIGFVLLACTSDLAWYSIVGCTIGYLSLGILWSRSRYAVLNMESIQKLEQLKERVAIGDISVPEAQSHAEKIKEQMKVTSNKEKIACWILGFLPSFIYHVSDDLVTHLKELIVTKLKGVYRGISMKYQEKAEQIDFASVAPEVDESEKCYDEDSFHDFDEEDLHVKSKK